MSKMPTQTPKITYKSEPEISTEKTLYRFSPCTLTGHIQVPPSKSYLHRYLLAAALAQTELTLKGVSTLADDIRVSLEILTHLGFDFTYNETSDELYLSPSTRKRDDNIDINMKESGTSLRLFLPLLIHSFDKIHVSGENQLPQRPLAPYFDALCDAQFTRTTANNLPVHISGKITPQAYLFTEQMSSQFISGLLFLLPCLETGSTISLSEPPLSLPYIQMTLNVLKQFQITIKHNTSYTEFTIPGPQSYITPLNKQIMIEPDYSSRAYWDVANALEHESITVIPPVEDSLQGDAILSDIINKRKTNIDIAATPDLAPILALYLSQTTGGSLHNVHVLIHKESNRLEAIIDFLKRSAIPFTLNGHTLHIKKGKVQSNVYNTYNDHRITMMLIIASTIASGPIYLSEFTSVQKSYPTFIDHYQNLGGIIYEQ